MVTGPARAVIDSLRVPHQMSLAVGTRLGPYEILAPLGAGGMSEVWRARDAKLGRDVALKVLPEELARDPERLARFEREARAVAALNHPNIVTVYSVDEVAGVRFITMEVVEGRTLAELIPEDGMQVDTLLRLAIPLADALASAHERGVIHRDLKPGNVMVTTEGRVKVLDFGLAKLTAADSSDPELTATGLTRGGQIIGTPAYMSPEQAEGRSVDHRSDIFSLGSVLYQMATGKRPFTGETQAAVISAILRDTPVAISRINPVQPAGLSDIVQRCLQKDREMRYPSAGEAFTELKALEMSLAPARPGRLPRKAWTAIAATVVAAIVAVAIAGFLFVASVWKHEDVKREPMLRELTANPPEIPVGEYAISRDGKVLAYRDRAHGLAFLQIDTGEIKSFPNTGSLRPFDWFPDGAHLLVGQSNLTSGVWKMSTWDGTVRKFLDSSELAIISPDGTRILFHDPEGVTIAGPNGEDPRIVPWPAGGRLPDWSPTGRGSSIRWIHRNLGTQ